MHSELESLLGLTVEAARQQAQARGFQVRVIEEDGEGLPHTADYRTDRINLVVEQGKVVGAEIG